MGGNFLNIERVFFASLKMYLQWGNNSLRKKKKKKVQKSRAWVNEFELTKESKINLVWQSPLIRTDKGREVIW